MDKAAERLRQFEDARVPQELFNDPEIKANQSINEVSPGKKEDTGRPTVSGNRTTDCPGINKSSFEGWGDRKFEKEVIV